MKLDAPLEAVILGWVAARGERGPTERSTKPLVEVLADELGLDANPDTLSELAATLTRLEAAERLVLDAPAAVAVEVAPLDLAATRPTGKPSGDVAEPPRVEAYSELATAPWHVQLNWALRALRDATDPRTGQGEFDVRHAVQQLGLNAKDVRHDLEALGLLRRVKSGEAARPDLWWVDHKTTVTTAMVDELRHPAPPPPAAMEQPALPSGPSNFAELNPLIDSLTRLEARFGPLLQQLVQAAQSVSQMAQAQASLLRQQTAQIERLQAERGRLAQDLADLSRDYADLRLRVAKSAAADELTTGAGELRTAERRMASTGGEIDDKLRRITGRLRETAADMPDE